MDYLRRSETEEETSATGDPTSGKSRLFSAAFLVLSLKRLGSIELLVGATPFERATFPIPLRSITLTSFGGIFDFHPHETALPKLSHVEMTG